MSNPASSYHGSRKWQANWADPVDVKQWMDAELFEGETLNVCCGQNYAGDVRVDIDPKHDPDVCADIHDLPFDDGDFDTVYVDPPFSLYAYPDGYWPPEVWRIANKRLILNCPGKRVNLPHSEKSWYILEPNPGSSLMSVAHLQVFDRPNKLTEWSV